MSTTISAGVLAGAIGRVKPHAGTDDTLPAINGVHLTVEGGYFFAVATDRYTFGIDRTAISSEETWKVNLRRADIPMVMAWLDRIEAGENITVKVSTGEGLTTLTLKHGANSLQVSDKSSHLDTFPKWRKMTSQILQRDVEPVPVTGFNSKYLARWRAAGLELDVWQAGPNSPLVVTTKDGFLGLQMPIRNDSRDREDTVAEWVNALRRRQAVVEGVTYDLSIVWADRHGDPWEYADRDDEQGQPLMNLVGIDDDPWPLARVVAGYGPLCDSEA
ncbi:phiSA1p31-related protein [Kitasatospora sp. NPDC047058]|uniref:phiSA1p31-related protein n=1 Tax=Kitasatospora sp. NPDC047058 TaxID=3155620 RepID=UPI003409DE98